MSNNNLITNNSLISNNNLSATEVSHGHRDLRMDDEQLQNAIEAALARKIIFQFDSPKELAEQIIKNGHLRSPTPFLHFITYLIKLHASDHSYNMQSYRNELKYVIKFLEDEILRINQDIIINQLKSEGPIE